MTKNTKAFTLVELAIVIVIIGLLVSGVLVGRELIEAAKVVRAVSDVRRYTAAIETFRGKYNAIPGDMRNAYTFFDGSGGSDRCGPNNTPNVNDVTGCNGNGDRLLGAFTYNSEAAKLWVHLSLSNILPGVVTYHPGASYRELITFPEADANVPLSNIGPKAGFDFMSIRQAFAYPDAASIFYGQKGLWMTLTKPDRVTGAWHWLYRVDRTITTSASFAIDSKMDDGLPTTGQVIAVTNFVAGEAYKECGTTFLRISSVPTIVPSDTIKYAFTETGPSCALMFKMGIE